MSLYSRTIRLAYSRPEIRPALLPLLREAGIFEAPPAILASVVEWMKATYAGHILARTEKELESTLDALLPVRRALQEMEATAGKLESAVAGLKEGEAFKFKVYGKSWSSGIEESVWGVKRTGDSYLWGTGEKSVSFKSQNIPWKWPREPTLQEVIQTYSKLLTTKRMSLESMLSRDVSMVQPKEGPSADELANLIAECKKYTSTAKSYATSAKKKFDFDLTGWKYLNALEQREAGKKLAAEGWKGFTAILDFKGTQNKGGVWNWGALELTVELGSGTTSRYVRTPERANTVDGFQFGLSEIDRVARHEVQHIGQDLLRIIKGLREDGGLPSRKIRNLDFNPLGVSVGVDAEGKKFQRTHPLRDSEFYTVLSDEIDRFIRWAARGIPQEKMRDAIRVWAAVGQDPAKPEPMRDEAGEIISAAQGFFLTLKAYDPLKWKKAVSEFVKAVAHVRGMPSPRND